MAINISLDGYADHTVGIVDDELHEFFSQQLDEYWILIHPVVAGTGRRLFEGANINEMLKLKLLESKVFKSGVVALHYVSDN